MNSSSENADSFTGDELHAGAQLDDLDRLLGGFEGSSAQEVAAARRTQPAPSALPGSNAPSQAEPPDMSRAWMLWWAPTILVPLVGGVVAWFALRNKRQQAARAMFVTALIMGALASVLFLRFAPEIAVFTNTLNSNTKVTLPATTANTPDSNGGSGTLGNGSPSAVQ